MLGSRSDCRCRFRQVRDAIFLPVSRNPEFQIRIAQFSRAANCAAVQWLILSRSLRFETPPARRNFFAMAGVVDDISPKKNQIRGQRSHD